jgi:hypothetical protein
MDEGKIRLKEAVTALYFGTCLKSELQQLYGYSPRHCESFIQKLDKSMEKDSSIYHRQVNALLGIVVSGKYQQYSEHDMRSAITHYLLGTLKNPEIRSRFGVPQKTLYNKLSEIGKILGFDDVKTLKQLAVDNFEQIESTLDRMSLLGTTKECMLSDCEVAIITGAASASDEHGLGWSRSMLGSKIADAIHAKGRAIVEVFGQNMNDLIL